MVGRNQVLEMKEKISDKYAIDPYNLNREQSHLETMVEIAGKNVAKGLIAKIVRCGCDSCDKAVPTTVCCEPYIGCFIYIEDVSIETLSERYSAFCIKRRTVEDLLAILEDISTGYNQHTKDFSWSTYLYEVEPIDDKEQEGRV